MAKRKRRTQVDFDLNHVRKLKRLARRLYAGLDEVDRYLSKVAKSERQATPSPEAVELALETYRLATDRVMGHCAQGPTCRIHGQK